MVDDIKLTANLDQYLPLRDVVFNTLREAIIKGDLKPGERLMENQLADKLGVSRTPVREAIRKLELENLVVMIPRKGAEVAKITEKDIRDVLEVRAALESLAVELACEKISQEQIKQLLSVKEAFKEAIKTKDVHQIVSADIEFHQVILEATNNDKLMHILNNLKEHIYRFRVKYIYQMKDYTTISKEHEEMVNRIINKDIEGSKEVTYQHIKEQEEAVIEMIKASV